MHETIGSGGVEQVVALRRVLGTQSGRKFCASGGEFACQIARSHLFGGIIVQRVAQVAEARSCEQYLVKVLPVSSSHQGALGSIGLEGVFVVERGALLVAVHAAQLQVQCAGSSQLNLLLEVDVAGQVFIVIVLPLAQGGRIHADGLKAC